MDDSTAGSDAGYIFATAFKMKLLSIIDDPVLVYSWGLAASMDGRRSHLQWMRRIWDNKSDWPTVTEDYPTFKSFIDMLMLEVSKLVSGTRSAVYL